MMSHRKLFSNPAFEKWAYESRILRQWDSLSWPQLRCWMQEAEENPVTPRSPRKDSSYLSWIIGEEHGHVMTHGILGCERVISPKWPSSVGEPVWRKSYRKRLALVKPNWTPAPPNNKGNNMPNLKLSLLIVSVLFRRRIQRWKRSRPSKSAMSDRCWPWKESLTNGTAKRSANTRPGCSKKTDFGEIHIPWVSRSRMF